MNAVTGDGRSNILVGFLNRGVDGLADATYSDISGLAQFHGATVNPGDPPDVPEPGTGSLLGLGALILAARRRRGGLRAG